jgi:hypothetical protein
MIEIEWDAPAILTGRRMRTLQGNLATCLRQFLLLPDKQRSSALVVVPGCIQIDDRSQVRSFAGDALVRLARRLPVGHKTSTV